MIKLKLKNKEKIMLQALRDEVIIKPLFEENKGLVGHKAFVALCRYEKSEGYKCELGKIVMAFETVE